MRRVGTILRYEMLNAMRSRWLYGYTVFIAVCVFGFFNLSDDPVKAQLSITTVFCSVIPLVSILFGCMSWYQSELFTQLLLTQPVDRRTLFCARVMALSLSLALSLCVGLLLPMLLLGVRDSGVMWLFAASLFLSFVYCLLGTVISGYLADRMWGLGSAVLIWVYSALIHDGLILLMLIGLREYPVDLWSSLVCALNPIGLTRVVLLLHYDAPLLLGHSGALVRNLVESGEGYFYAALIGASWILFPLCLAYRKFIRRDFYSS